MKEFSRDIEGMWVPREVWLDSELTIHEKFLFGLLISKGGRERIYNGGNAELSKKLLIRRSRLSQLKHSLSDKGYITIVSSENIVEQLIAKNLRGLGYGWSVCKWCKIYTAVLHEHHYPIPRSEGGTETVGICPNCHQEFHSSENVIKINLTEEQVVKMLEDRDEFLRGVR